MRRLRRLFSFSFFFMRAWLWDAGTASNDSTDIFILFDLILLPNFYVRFDPFLVSLMEFGRQACCLLGWSFLSHGSLISYSLDVYVFFFFSFSFPHIKCLSIFLLLSNTLLSRFMPLLFAFPNVLLLTTFYTCLYVLFMTKLCV